MTEEQALELLYKISTVASLPKATHDQCQQAAIILKKLIDDSKNPK